MKPEYKYLRITNRDEFSTYEKSLKSYFENDLPDDDINFILVKETVVNVTDNGTRFVIHEFDLTHNNPDDDTGCVYCSASVEFDEFAGLDSVYISGFVIDNDEPLFDHSFYIAALQDCSVLESLESVVENFPKTAVKDKFYFYSEFGSWLPEDCLEKAEAKNYEDIDCVDFPVVKACRLTNCKMKIIRYQQYEQVVI